MEICNWLRRERIASDMLKRIRQLPNEKVEDYDDNFEYDEKKEEDPLTEMFSSTWMIKFIQVFFTEPDISNLICSSRSLQKILSIEQRIDDSILQDYKFQCLDPLLRSCGPLRWSDSACADIAYWHELVICYIDLFDGIEDDIQPVHLTFSSVNRSIDLINHNTEDAIAVVKFRGRYLALFIPTNERGFNCHDEDVPRDDEYYTANGTIGNEGKYVWGQVMSF